jgi:hypothetical protein
MEWVLRLVETGIDGPARVIDVLDIRPLGGLGEIAKLGLTLAEAKQILARLQQVVVAVQADDHAVLRPDCSSCGQVCHVKEWRLHRVATLFGTAAVRPPRFRCAGCGFGEAGRDGLDRFTPQQSQHDVSFAGCAPSLDWFVNRRLRRGGCHGLVRLGSFIGLHIWVIRCPTSSAADHVEAFDGGRQVFGAVAKADTEIAVLIRRSLETVGRAADTELTAFTDGAPGLRSILSEAGCKTPPIADWFHIAMRLRHAKQAASGLSTDTPGRMQAKAVIVPEGERLHWRI